MGRLGFIHGKLDIKLLILYLLARLSAPIDFTTLTDLCLCDDGVDYFLFAEAVPELVESGHICRQDDGYAITDKGRRAGADGESSLSPVIRQRCDVRMAPLIAAMRRSAEVRGQVDPMGQAGFQVRLELGQPESVTFSMSLLAPTQESAQRILQRFHDHPDQVYNGVLKVLLPDNPQKGGSA